MLPEPVDTTEAQDGPELTRQCPICHTAFALESPFSKRLYCSPVCRNRGKVDKTLVSRNCRVCQNEFQTPEHRPRFFCSQECRIGARGREEMRETRACAFCKGEFTALKTVRQNYCSPRCRKDAERERDRQRDQERALRLGEPARHGPIPAPAPARMELPPPPMVRAQARTPVRDVLEPAATRNCPHCDQPITIVALLATPEAARPVIHPARDAPPLRRVP
ncbi:hypothetical protein ACFVT9_28045 [Kitasatospora cineracea]|uniref:hypothetical protein n=1 Tax=Kitasatospora cineracea TaxID=88074 RepID=UPI0036DA6401